MQPDITLKPQFTSVRTRAVVAFAVGFVAALAAGFLGSWQLAPLVGWDVTAVVFTTWILAKVLPLSGAETEVIAGVEDPSRAVADGLLLFASVASLIAVGVFLVGAGSASGATKTWQVGLAVVSVILSWALVHTIFTLRYARLYYQEPVGGVDFNSDELPSYVDFAYLAVTIGMTFQVSDTSLSSRHFRATALRHALLSYLFGTVIVATTINLMAGLSK